MLILVLLVSAAFASPLPPPLSSHRRPSPPFPSSPPFSISPLPPPPPTPNENPSLPPLGFDEPSSEEAFTQASALVDGELPSGDGAQGGSYPPGGGEPSHPGGVETHPGGVETSHPGGVEEVVKVDTGKGSFSSVLSEGGIRNEGPSSQGHQNGDSGSMSLGVSAHFTREVLQERNKASKVLQRTSRDSVRPPLVLAQQSSEISLEPTEVEAPGTTPTTVAMVTETFGDAGERSNKTVKANTNNNNNNSNNNDNLYIRNKNIGDTENKSISSLSSTKDMTRLLDDSLQKDDPTANLKETPDEGRTRVNAEFKIRTFNKTYTLVHQKTYSNKKKHNLTRQESRDKKEEAKVARNNPEQKEYSSLSVNNNPGAENTKEESNVSKSTNRESKKIVTQPQRLLNVSSNNKGSFKSPINVVKDSTRRSDSSGIPRNKLAYLREESKFTVLVDRHGDSDSLKKSKNLETSTSSESDQVGTTTAITRTEEDTSKISDIDSRSEVSDDIKDNKEEQISNMGTKETETDSFFGVSNSGISGRKVKKDGSDTNSNPFSDTPNDKVYHLDVITSSSEVSYKQFDPITNISQLNYNFGSPNTSQTKETHAHLTPHPPKDVDGHADSSTALALPNRNTANATTKSTLHAVPVTLPSDAEGEEGGRGGEEGSKHEGKHGSTSYEEANVTSLPNQTSVVEPIRANSSSPLSHVTLPSPSISKSIAPYPLLGGQPLPAGGDVGTSEPPLQQERVSIPVSEQVDRPIGTGSVVAIVMGVLFSMALVGGVAAYLVYQRMEGFRPKILSSDRSCANSDSGGYLDDQCRVAYVNSQIDLPKSTPEDLVSLDNDSFLNSLESMTIQNLWTDSIRHTKL